MSYGSSFAEVYHQALPMQFAFSTVKGAPSWLPARADEVKE
jgi:hypothetical protein